MLKNIQKLLMAILIFMFCFVTISGQQIGSADTTATNSLTKKSESDEFNKNEFYAGYSIQRFNNNYNSNGLEISFVRNLKRFVGLKTDFTFRFAKNNCLECGVGGAERRKLTSFQGGIQFKDNTNERKLKPFAHLMTGWSRNFGKLCSVSICGQSLGANQFALTFGGGLDVKVSKKISIRVVQVDYNPTFSDGFKYHNLNVGFGIVFH